MTIIEQHYMESVAANLPRIAKALERIAAAAEKPKALLRIAKAIKNSEPMMVCQDPVTCICPQPNEP